MNSRVHDTFFHNLPDILFSFLSMLNLGGFLLLFLTAYFTFDNALFTARFEAYFAATVYLWIAGLAGVLIYILYYGGISSHHVQTSFAQPASPWRPVLVVAGFLVFQTIVVIVHFLGLRIQFFHFIAFLTALYALFSVARFYTFSGLRLAWQHPTTAGSILEGTGALGCAVGLWFFQKSNLQVTYGWLLLTILVFESLTLWSRFRFLSHAHPITRQAVSMMLGSQITSFGIRFIVGLVMPLVYLLWALIVSRLVLTPVIAMILIGEFAERALFFITALPGASGRETSAQQPNPVENKSPEQKNASD